MLNGEALLAFVTGGLTQNADLQSAVSALQANGDTRGQRQRTTLDTRAFKQAFSVTPARWRSLLRGSKHALEKGVNKE